MTKNTNPFSSRLLIKEYWLSRSLPLNEIPENSIKRNKGTSDYFQDKYIRELIHGTFMKLGLITSEIRLSKNCLGKITIQFFYYPLIYKNQAINYKFNKYLTSLIQIIKSILNLKYPNFTFKLICIKAPHKFVDAKLLNDYINFNVMDDPNKLKFVYMNLIREYKNLIKWYN